MLWCCNTHGGRYLGKKEYSAAVRRGVLCPDDLQNFLDTLQRDNVNIEDVCPVDNFECSGMVLLANGLSKSQIWDLPQVNWVGNRVFWKDVRFRQSFQVRNHEIDQCSLPESQYSDRLLNVSGKWTIPGVVPSAISSNLKVVVLPINVRKVFLTMVGWI